MYLALKISWVSFSWVYRTVAIHNSALSLSSLKSRPNFCILQGIFREIWMGWEWMNVLAMSSKAFYNTTSQKVSLYKIPMTNGGWVGFFCPDKIYQILSRDFNWWPHERGARFLPLSYLAVVPITHVEYTTKITLHNIIIYLSSHSLTGLTFRVWFQLKFNLHQIVWFNSITKNHRYCFKVMFLI